MFSIEVPEDSGSLRAWRTGEKAVEIELSHDLFGRPGQWFYFKVSGFSGPLSLRVIIKNAGQSLYPGGWRGYRPVISEDGLTWKRASPIEFDERSGVASFRTEVTGCSAELAWYEPYPLARLRSWTASISEFAGLRLDFPLENFPVISLGAPQDGTIILLARQHPGETMGSHFIEGFVDKLVVGQHSQFEALLKRTQIVVFPMMNPCGVAAGKHRYSVEGTDYNRAWEGGDQPAEIMWVRNLLQASNRVLHVIDVHGDEVRCRGPNYLDVNLSCSANKAAAASNFRKLLIQKTHDLENFDPYRGWRGLVRRLLYGKRRGSRGTIADFACNNLGVPALTYEIKAHGTTRNLCLSLGASLAEALREYDWSSTEYDL